MRFSVRVFYQDFDDTAGLPQTTLCERYIARKVDYNTAGNLVVLRGIECSFQQQADVPLPDHIILNATAPHVARIEINEEKDEPS